MAGTKIAYLPKDHTYEVTYRDAAGKRCRSRKSLSVPTVGLDGLVLGPEAFKKAMADVRISAIRLFNEMDESGCERL